MGGGLMACGVGNWQIGSSFVVGGPCIVGTSSIPVIDATTQATNISASRSYDAGFLAVDGTTAAVVISNGLSYTDGERTCVTFEGVIDHVAGGLPFTDDGRLCVSVAPTASITNEMPFTSDGRIAVSLV